MSPTNEKEEPTICNVLRGWAQLRHLDSHSHSVHRVLDTFDNCEQLTTLCKLTVYLFVGSDDLVLFCERTTNAFKYEINTV